MSPDRTHDVEALMRRWDQLSKDPQIPTDTRRVLRICLDDLSVIFGPTHNVSHEHPSGEHDE